MGEGIGIIVFIQNICEMMSQHQDAILIADIDQHSRLLTGWHGRDPICEFLLLAVGNSTAQDCHAANDFRCLKGCPDGDGPAV